MNDIINYTDKKLIEELESRGYIVISKFEYNNVEGNIALIDEIRDMASRIVVHKTFNNKLDDGLVQELLSIILNKVKI